MLLLRAWMVSCVVLSLLFNLPVSFHPFVAAANLGTCFGPNVLRPTVEGADPITAINQTRALNRILFWCIANPAIVN